MRFMHFLALVVPASAAGTCGVGPVDLSGVKPFVYQIDCPANKNAEGIQVGCVNRQSSISPYLGVAQKSNKFFVQACGAYESKVPECQVDSYGVRLRASAVLQVTEDLQQDGSTITRCFSMGSSIEPKFSLLGKYTKMFLKTQLSTNKKMYRCDGADIRKHALICLHATLQPRHERLLS